MKKFKIFCVGLLCVATIALFGGCTIGVGTNFRDLSHVIKETYPTVVSIEATTEGGRTSSGSGVIIYATDEFSLVATNAHVIGEWNKSTKTFVKSKNFRIINWSYELYYGEYGNTESKYIVDSLGESNIIYANINEDLAIIKYTPRMSSGARGKSSTLRWEEDRALRVGEPVAALGNSVGRYQRASQGIVSQIFREFSGTDTDGVTKKFDWGFMHDATAIQGNSGGPVIDAEGYVIGLTTLVVTMCEPECTSKNHVCYHPALGFSIAISSRHIYSVLDANRSAWGIA